MTVTLAPVWVLSMQVWLVATTSDSAEMGHFHRHGAFSYTVLAGLLTFSKVRLEQEQLDRGLSLFDRRIMEPVSKVVWVLRPV